MIMIDEKTAIVFDTDDLRDAVSSDNGVELVYFGDNITLAYGITIYPDKARLVIDGTYYGVVHTFTDIEGTSDAQTLGIRAASNIDLTIQNINLVGMNFFGIPYVSPTVNTDNVTVSYIDMKYTGKQVIYHRRGLTRFIGCNITIAGQPSGEVEEVGEVCKVEIGGKTTIVKTNNEDAVFWFHGSSTRKSYLKILAGADVEITTQHYFMYENYSPDFIIETGASLTLNTNSGFSYDGGHTVASFLVAEDASFRFTQNANRGFATLYLDGALTVNDGATFYMQADFANNYPLIRFTGGSGSMNLNNPRSFALYNRGGTDARAFYFAARIPFVFAGNQVNRWDVPKAFPAAGTFDDEPRYKWKRPNYGPFRMEGRADNSNTYVDYHNFTQEELDQMPLLDDLKLREAIVFSEGNLPLSVNRIVIGRRPITGKTAKKARVRISPVAGGHYPDRDADDRGIFSVTPTDPVPFAEMFTVTSNTPFLLTALTVESQEEGGLSLVDAPVSITFIIPPLEGFSDTILRRQVQEISVTVLDERSDRTEWVIWAKITGPLQTEENNVLEDAVVFADQAGELITLGLAYLPVHTDGPYDDIDEVPVTWVENKGVLARITVPIRSGRKYSTQLDWVVYPVGVQPEGGV